MNMASKWRDKLARAKEERSDVVEVMDVLIQSNRFLRIRDPEGNDILGSEKYF